jgi:hypothetical protein
MAPIWLAKFNQPPWLDSTMHWGIFVAFEPAGDDNHDIPKTGTLFHISQHCDGVSGSCTSSLEIYHKTDQFELSNSKKLASAKRLEDTDVSIEQIDKVCQRVSLNRPFNLVTRNCQEWVKEVLEEMVGENLIPEKVFHQMEKDGFQTMSERSTDSVNQPLSFTSWK